MQKIERIRLKIEEVFGNGTVGNINFKYPQFDQFWSEQDGRSPDYTLPDSVYSDD